jgi:hypothetical protein
VPPPASERLRVAIEADPELSGVRGRFIAVLRSGLEVFTAGLWNAQPNVTVYVIDRQTERCLISHDWGKEVETAQEDLRSITNRLESLNLDAFCDEYGIDRPVPP